MFHVAITSCSMLQAYLWLIWRFHPQTRPDCDRRVAIVRSCKCGLHVSFIGLPVASFAVNSATPAHDLALVTGRAEWRLANAVSLLAKFDGEFANRSQTYSGTGRIRYAW